METYTRFGTKVEIRYRCDDFDQSLSVHVADADNPNGDLRTVYVSDLVMPGKGMVGIYEMCNAVPVAHCTGKHLS